MTPPFASFGEAEHRERMARARRSLAAAGFDGCVSVAPEHLYYLAGYDAWVSVNSPQALVFRTDGGEPTIVLRDVDRPLATETSWVRDLRTYRLLAEDPAALIAGVAREHGLGHGRLAVELVVDGKPSLDLHGFRFSRFAEGAIGPPRSVL
jgi:Xaa-Pro aminopeptidase